MFFILLMCAQTLQAQINLNLGLMAYYPFSGNANDMSGNNNNPIFNNATLTTDRFGNSNSAYLFNGINNYMMIPNSATLNPNNQISLCAWVKVNGFYQGTCHGNAVMMKGDGDFLAGNYCIRFDDNPYTNGQNCTNPVVNVNHENFYGVNLMAAPPGYTPYIQTGTWYCVIYTSDGTTSKLYVNCSLKVSGPANNITFSNAYNLYLGKMNTPNYPYWFNGAMDEVRIYNRVLNQQEIDSLGGCSSPVSSTIINNYTPVLSFNPCNNDITVEDATPFNTGDTVMMIQMKGAVIDSSNTSAFGTITDYKNAGNYEFNYIKSISANIIELKNKLTRQYDLPNGKVQLVRVPYYTTTTMNTTLTCLPWDGSKGGVLVLNAQDSVILNANIDVSGKGFSGGSDPFSNPPLFYCNENQFYYPPNPDLASEKGEGIAIISADKSFGKGARANGGGSGNSHNSGGGGGSNGGSGGFGGYNFEGTPCTNVPFDNRGIGGNVLLLNNNVNKIFPGGGGGAGHTNNPEGFEALGGNGGGIAIIITNKIRTNGNKIVSNGADGLICGSTGPLCHEGMGAGGAGGTILLKVNNYADNIQVETKGGNGVNMTAVGFLRVGPGGGGGGGVLWISNPSIPGNLSVNNNGGTNGVCTGYANDPWGATAGQSGVNLFNLVIPVDNTPFKPNIDSVRFNYTRPDCNSFSFAGLAYTNNNPVFSWQWDFGDGNSAQGQNNNHAYVSSGAYTVKLVVTDSNGCTDSISKFVTVAIINLDAGPDKTICQGNSASLQGSQTGATLFSWSPVAYLNNPSILNPVANPPVTSKFYLTASNATGCSQQDSVTVFVRSASAFTISQPAGLCPGNSIQLLATGADFYTWSPTATLNNPSVSNPMASPIITTTYSVLLQDTLCGNTNTLTTNITVWPLPTVKASKSNDLDCIQTQSILFASGAKQYNWSPSNSLNNPYTPSPVAQPVVTTTYTVTGTDMNGCVNSDTVTIKVSNDNKYELQMPTAFTPNNDGLNDCYGIKKWGIILQLEFSIYNRWGARIFFTKNPADCWDGTYRGVQQDAGIYIYTIKAKTTCTGDIFREGTFVLIR